MEDMKNKSLLRQIQTKLSYLKKYEKESPSAFQEIIISNRKVQISHSKNKINKILSSPLKNNVTSLKGCYQCAINRLWYNYYKISRKEYTKLNENFEINNKDQNLSISSVDEHHVLSLRELASFAVADNINKNNYYSEQNIDDNDDPFHSVPSYIPNYLNNLIFFEYITNICIEKINIPNILKSLIGICYKNEAYHQAYKLLKKHFILSPYKDLPMYEWAYTTSQKIFKKQEFLNFMTENITIYHIYQPTFINVINFFKNENKNTAYKLVENAIRIMISYLINYTNEDNSILSYIPIDMKFKHENSSEEIFSSSSSSSLQNLSSSSSLFPIDLNNKINLNYYYSLCRYYTKLYIEMIASYEYTIVNTPLDLIPLDINPLLIKNFKCIFSPLVIQHLLNYDKKYYKLYYPELYQYQISQTTKKNKSNLKKNPIWKKCYQCCQNMDYQFLEELFKFSRKLKKFQLLIEMMENLGLYDEAFTYVNWIYDTLNSNSVTPFKEEGRYSRRKRKVINYNEYYSDEDENDENNKLSTPKQKSRIKPKPKSSPQITSPFSPNKLNRYLPSLYQKAAHLAKIINSYSSDTVWQYEASIESWMKKKKRKYSSPYKNSTNININNENNKHLDTYNVGINSTNDIIVIDDNDKNDVRNYLHSNKNEKTDKDFSSNNGNEYKNNNIINNLSTKTKSKKTQIIYYIQDDSSVVPNDKITIQEPLPINDELDEFLL